MNQEDRNLILGALTELKADIGLIKTDIADLKTDVSALKTDVTEIKEDVTGLKTDVKSLKSEVRHNGVLIERNKESIDWLVESQKTLNGRVGRLEKDVDEIRENTADLPTLHHVVKKHSLQLTALGAK